MPASVDARARRVHLVKEQLHEQEEVDGLFDVSVNRVVAVTSERLMIVSGGDPQGWAQMSIPWRVITAVQLGPPEEDGLVTVGVEYTRRRSWSHRTEEGAMTAARADLQPDTAEGAQRLSALIDLRRASAG